MREVWIPAAADFWTIAPSVAAAVAAGASAWAAIVLNRTQRDYNISDTLLRVNERLDAPHARRLKEGVYRLWDRRSEPSSWTAAELEMVDRWCAELDLISLLVLADQLEVEAFFSMYGDVLVRSVYIVAPYVNEQRDNRGPQFLLPLSQLTEKLVDVWSRLARKGRYPNVIDLKYGSCPLTPQWLRSEPAVRAFNTVRFTS